MCWFSSSSCVLGHRILPGSIVCAHNPFKLVPDLSICHHGILSFSRGSGEFDHGTMAEGAGEDTPADDLRGEGNIYRSGGGVHCWESAMAMGVSRPCLFGTGEQGAPAGPPKRRPARKSIQIPCVAKTLAGILADVFMGERAGRCWWEGKRLTGRAGSFAVGDADAAGDIRAYVGIYYCVFDGDGPSSF